MYISRVNFCLAVLGDSSPGQTYKKPPARQVVYRQTVVIVSSPLLIASVYADKNGCGSWKWYRKPTSALQPSTSRAPDSGSRVAYTWKDLEACRHPKDHSPLRDNGNYVVPLSSSRTTILGWRPTKHEAQQRGLCCITALTEAQVKVP